MKKLLLILLVVCFSTTLFAQTIVSTEPSNRNMILEEFTGKSCQYCPDGHKRAQQLMNQYPDRFFAINVHQGGYANGSPNYTTPYGDALALQAGMGMSGTGYPGGTVNRQAFTGVSTMGSSYFLYDRGQWASCVAKGIIEPSCLNVAAEGVLDWKERKLTLLVEVYYTGNAEQSTNKLNVAMLQNDILGSQSGSDLNPDMIVGGQYRHMHMLRDFITGQWGVDVTPTTQGSFRSFTFEYDIPIHINNVYVALSDVEFVVYVAENQKTIISGSIANITDVNKCFTINASASPAQGGTIDPIGYSTYDEGESPEYIFLPNYGFEVRYVSIDGQSIGVPDGNKYQFSPLDKDHNINVVYKKGAQSGIKDINGITISVAPNPVNDKLFITGEYDRLDIFSLSGQLISTAYNQSSIDVSQLAKGVYIVKIETNGQTATFNVVK
jgi:hypothetical protein